MFQSKIKKLLYFRKNHEEYTEQRPYLISIFYKYNFKYNVVVEYFNLNKLTHCMSARWLKTYH